MRTIITHDPYLHLKEDKAWSSFNAGRWPCHWIGCPEAGDPPFATAYRKRFLLDKAAAIRVHVSADERYELFLDGERIGRGSERGDKDNWFYETYDLQLDPGSHVLVARVWSLGRLAPYAQLSAHPGFLLSPEVEFIELLGTGVAEWDAKRLEGYEFIDPLVAWGTGGNLVIGVSQFPWGFEQGEGDDWNPTITLQPGMSGFVHNEFPHRDLHLLKPATLPPMIEVERQIGKARFVADAPSADTSAIAINAQDNLEAEVIRWNNLLRAEKSLTIPAQTTHRVIVDLENYYCAYPEIITFGGAGSRLRILWAEALYLEPYVREKGHAAKGNRDEIESKYFYGIGDTFQPDGGAQRKFETLWWQAGRYLEILVQTTDEALTLEHFAFRETHYPLELESTFEASDPRLARVIPIALRGLQMCSHETYMDCPYYEQLMYVGDTRLEVLTTYISTRDDRLPRKALRMFDVSRRTSGLTQSRYPSRVTQIIPPFSLWWVAMVHDYALWRDDLDFVRSLMPGVRAVMDAYRTFMNDDGLIQGPISGWNFMDWVPGWQSDGVPPEGAASVSGLINWQMILILGFVAELEAWMGEPELSARARRLASELAKRVSEAFWNESRGLFADDLSKQHFSEHTQCLAILSGQLNSAKSKRLASTLLTDTSLARTTIYFTHYLFEAYRSLGLTAALFDRLQLWFDLEKNGFKTTFESPEPTRSDCHAWGAHPLYHYFASILGIRPGEQGFRSVNIAPQLGPLTHAKGTLVHPQGEIEVDFRIEKDKLKGSITLPEGVSGTLNYGGKTKALKSGQQEI